MQEGREVEVTSESGWEGVTLDEPLRGVERTQGGEGGGVRRVESRDERRAMERALEEVLESALPRRLRLI